MDVSRKRRNVKRAVIALALAMLLLAGYLGSWIGMFWLVGRGTINGPTVERLNTTVFAPASLYVRTGLPGYRVLADAGVWAQNRGHGNSKTWRQIRSRWD